LELTTGKRFLVFHPDEISRRNAKAHCTRELKMICAGSWADGSDQAAIDQAVDKGRIDLVVIHRSLAKAESDPYQPLATSKRPEAPVHVMPGSRSAPTAAARAKRAASSVETLSPPPDDGGVGAFLQHLSDSVKKRWRRRPAVVMTSWLAVAGSTSSHGDSSLSPQHGLPPTVTNVPSVNSASQMFMPSAHEFEQLVDAHVYIPYRTAGMTEAVLQAMESVRMLAALRRGSGLSDTSNDAIDGELGHVDILPAAEPMPAPKPRRKDPNKPSSEIDHTLGKRLPMRTLVVDDNSVNLLLATRFLEKMGFEGVQCADDGQVAIDMVKEAINKGTPFDLILCDVNMPVLDGLEASRQILAHCASLNLFPPVIIAVTADISEVSQARALECGMRGTLTKPIRIQVMQETLVAVGQEILVARQSMASPAAEFELKIGEGEVMKNRLKKAVKAVSGESGAGGDGAGSAEGGGESAA
jgi:CheY-like chemotaxis protein